MYDKLCATFPELAPENDWFAYQLLRREFRPNQPAYYVWRQDLDNRSVDEGNDDIFDRYDDEDYQHLFGFGVEVDPTVEDLISQRDPTNPYRALMNYGRRLSILALFKGWLDVDTIKYFQGIRCNIHVAYFGPYEHVLYPHVMKACKFLMGSRWFEETEESIATNVEGLGDSSPPVQESLIDRMGNEQEGLPLYSPVVFACARGDVRYLETLVSIGFKVESIAVREAIKYGRLGIVKKLYEMGRLNPSLEMLQYAIKKSAEIAIFIHQTTSMANMIPATLEMSVVEGRLDIVKYFTEMVGWSIDQICTPSTLDRLCGSNDPRSLIMVKYLVEQHKVPFGQQHAYLAAQSGATDTFYYFRGRLGLVVPFAKFLDVIREFNATDVLELMKTDYYQESSPLIIDFAVIRGCLELILHHIDTNKLNANPLEGYHVTSGAIAGIVGNGNLSMLKLLHQHMPDIEYSPLIFEMAAVHGHFEIIRFLCETHKYPDTHLCTTSAFDAACMNGYLDLVRYLHERFPKEGECSKMAMDGAAIHGLLDIVRFLHLNRKEGCTDLAIKGAVQHGDAEIVRYLCENDLAVINAEIMEQVLKSGDAEIIKLLWKKSTETVDTASLDWDGISEALGREGRIEPIQYLWDQGALRFKGRLLESAAQHGHLETVKLVYEILCERQDDADDYCDGKYSTGIGIWEAALNGHLDVLKYLYDCAGGFHFDYDCLIQATIDGHIAVVEFLLEKDPDSTIWARQASSSFSNAVSRSYLSQNYLRAAFMLAEKYDTINFRDFEPFFRRQIATSGNTNLVNLLMDKGMQFDAEDKAAAYASGDFGMLLQLSHIS
jgi:hypothetical protein